VEEARETCERLAVSGERRCWVMEANGGDFEKEKASHD
jgi:hypothetical protein